MGKIDRILVIYSSLHLLVIPLRNLEYKVTYTYLNFFTQASLCSFVIKDVILQIQNLKSKIFRPNRVNVYSNVYTLNQ